MGTHPPSARRRIARRVVAWLAVFQNPEPTTLVPEIGYPGSGVSPAHEGVRGSKGRGGKRVPCGHFGEAESDPQRGSETVYRLRQWSVHH